MSTAVASSYAKGFSPLYEERVTLIKAGSKEEAIQKASLLVGNARHTYKNEDGDTSTWTCRRVRSDLRCYAQASCIA